MVFGMAFKNLRCAALTPRQREPRCCPGALPHTMLHASTCYRCGINKRPSVTATARSPPPPEFNVELVCDVEWRCRGIKKRPSLFRSAPATPINIEAGGEGGLWYMTSCCSDGRLFIPHRNQIFIRLVFSRACMLNGAWMVLGVGVKSWCSRSVLRSAVCGSSFRSCRFGRSGIFGCVISWVHLFFHPLNGDVENERFAMLSGLCSS